MAEENRPTATQRAVAAFNESQAALKAFLGDMNIRDILIELEQLVEDYNQKLTAATNAVKAECRHSDQNKVFIDGIGAQKKFRRYYDAEYLANTLPADQFEEFATEKIVYELNVERLEQLVRQGEVDGVIVAEARRIEEQNPSLLPGTPHAYAIPAIPVDDNG